MKFGRKKTNDDELLEHAPIEELHEEEHVSGMIDPDQKREIGARKLKQLILMLLVGGVVGLGVIGYFGYDVVSELFPSGGKKEAPRIAMSEEELLKQLEYQKVLEDRIRTLENDKSQLTLDIDTRIARALQGVTDVNLKDQVNATNQQVAELAGKQAEINSTLAALNETIARLGTGAPGGGPVEPPQPKVGSGSETGIHNNVSGWTARITEFEEQLKRDAEANKPKFIRGAGIHAGVVIPGVLETKLVTSKALGEFFTTVSSTAPYEIMPGFYLPAGTKFIGKAEGDFEGRRIFVRITHLRYGDVTFEMNGMVLDKSGNPGMVTKYVDPTMQAAWGSLLPNILGAAASAAQEMTTYRDNSGNEQERPVFNTKNVLLQGAATSLQTHADAVMEAAAKKQPVIIVEKGIPVQIQILEKIPVELLIEAGVLQKTQ